MIEDSFLVCSLYLTNSFVWRTVHFQSVPLYYSKITSINRENQFDEEILYSVPTPGTLRKWSLEQWFNFGVHYLCDVTIIICEPVKIQILKISSSLFSQACFWNVSWYLYIYMYFFFSEPPYNAETYYHLRASVEKRAKSNQSHCLVSLISHIHFLRKISLLYGHQVFDVTGGLDIFPIQS